ncbi:Na(+)/H(+) exchange regulatory cofactor NHE-RF4 isoform X2 [Choloepus didactylus]|uniref:Na(+)/H(+) exchange regulatory cofactor NHE-RF4 isoform X2 n=1 Tax=Choloepus didactylus TaxID=27675 RepID=UPI0018A01DE0|nr:Na(+)/H(+) exchange regulatory cofactor NHE-RF4 isoform X2 [Choloepus didactylus]
METAADLRDIASLTLKFEFNPKLGIDNPVLSLAEEQDLSDPWSLKRPRFCLLSKEDGRSFGFHLRPELGGAGHVVCRVQPGSSAQRQGLREGDRILGVNSHDVEHEDYAVVVRRIRASGPRVLLMVWARQVHDVARAQQGNAAHHCPILGPGVRPRLCHIMKDEGGFGFSVTHGKQGPFWLVLSTGGAAERAGVPPGARLLEVNGVNVEKYTHHQLSRKVWLPVSVAHVGLGPLAQEADFPTPPPLHCASSPDLIFYLHHHPSLCCLMPRLFVSLCFVLHFWAWEEGMGRGACPFPLPPRWLRLMPCWVPAALAEWTAGDPAGGRARGGGTVSPARNAPGCAPGRGLCTACQAPLSAPRERAQGLRVPAPGGEGPWRSPCSYGRWSQDCQPRRPGCRLGTGWWLWPGRVWRGWAMKKRCPGSGRRVPASPSPSSILRLTASSAWFASPRSCFWRAQRLLPLPRTSSQPLWLRSGTQQLKTQLWLLSFLVPASAFSTLGLAVAMVSGSAVWPVALISSSPR